MTYSAGNCLVCITGVLLFLVPSGGGSVFIGCNMCQAAWEVPAPVTGWEHSIPEFAPHGFRAATEPEVRACGQDMGHVARVDDEQFRLFHQ